MPDPDQRDGDQEPAQQAEFEVAARWAHEAVLRVGPHAAVPATSTGSATPAALDWLLDRLDPVPGELLLDVGGGLGGPAAHAADASGCRPLVVDTSSAACRAARELFGLSTVRAEVDRLPVATAGVTRCWSLGVLCTLSGHRGWSDHLAELARVVAPGGGIALLVLVRVAPTELPGPEGNKFPSPETLFRLLSEHRLEVTDRAWVDELAPGGEEWERAQRQVEADVRSHHGDDPRHAAVQQQQRRIGALLDSGSVRRLLLACWRLP